MFRLDRSPKTPLSPLELSAGERGFRQVRTIKHPNILSCLEAAELETELVFATEKVQTLRSWLESDVFREMAEAEDRGGELEDTVAWGMHCLLSALKFLHEDCRSAHNNACLDTIFVSGVTGDWKLGGLDMLGRARDVEMFASMVPRTFMAPESDDGSANTTHVRDIWSLGKVLEAIYECAGKTVPGSLQKYVSRMFSVPSTKRPTAAQFLRCAFLSRPLVKDLKFLEVMTMKEPMEKKVFFETFDGSRYPKEVREHRSVPGGSGGRAHSHIAAPPLLSC